jgi:hypothetical protein
MREDTTWQGFREGRSLLCHPAPPKPGSGLAAARWSAAPTPVADLTPTDRLAGRVGEAHGLVVAQSAATVPLPAGIPEKLRAVVGVMARKPNSIGSTTLRSIMHLEPCIMAFDERTTSVTRTAVSARQLDLTRGASESSLEVT